MAAPSIGIRGPLRISGGTVALYIALIAGSILTLMPLVYMVSQAFTPEATVNAWPIRFIPPDPTTNNFVRLFNDPVLPMFRWSVNSVFVSTATTALILLVSSLSGYAFARLEFPGRDIIFAIMLFSMMIPGAITFVPNFITMRKLGFLDSYNGLIWIHAAGAGGMFLLRQSFLTIPKELEEAAFVDGANRFRVYWQIALPLVTAAMITLAIGTFLGSWNDLFWPLVIMSDRDKLTLPVGLSILGQGNYVQRGLTMAAATVASAPILVLYAIFQRRIIQGMATTGLAGQ